MKLRSLLLSLTALVWCSGPIAASAQIKNPLVITCPDDVYVWTCHSGATQVSYPAPQVSGDCAPSAKVKCVPPSGSPFPQGTNQVVCTAVNSCGETQTCTFNVIVRRDVEPPVIQCPSNILAWACGPGGKSVNYPLPNVSDNADPNPSIVCNPLPNSVFLVGQTIVTCTVTDDCGNTAICSFTVTVQRDPFPPVVDCPADITVWTCNTFGRTVDFPSAEGADNSGEAPTVTCTPPSGSMFPVGTTTVVCAAVDHCSNRTECSFTVRVLIDNTPPVIQCSTNIVVEACDPRGARVTWPPPHASDNHSMPTTTCTPPSGSIFPVGVTPVICEAIDACGNRATCGFTVTVKASTALPAHDGNQDGLGDIWETAFQTGALLPGADADGDGMLNTSEEGAGTDPLNPDSSLALSMEVHLKQNKVQLEWPSTSYKIYQAQTTHDLGGVWRNVTPPLAGSNGVMSTVISMTDTNLPQPQPTNTFFRVRVSDVDMDQDGLTAWEEAIIGTTDNTPDTHGIPGGDHAAAEDWLVLNGYGPGRLREVALAHVGGTPDGPTETRLVTATGTGGWLKLSSWGVQFGNVQPVHLQDSPAFDGYLAQLHVLTPPVSPTLELNPFVSGRIRTGENVWFSVYTLEKDGTMTEHDTLGYGNNASFFVRDYAMAHRSLPQSGRSPRFQLVTPVLGVTTGNQPQMRVLTWIVNGDTGDLTAVYDTGNVGVPNVPLNGGRIQIAHQAGSRYVVSFADSNVVLSSWFFDVDEAGTAALRGGESSGLPLRGGTNVIQTSANDFALAPLNSAGFMTALLDGNCVPRLTVWEDRVVACDAACYSRPFYITDNSWDQSPTQRGILLDPPVVTDSREENSDSNEKFGAALAIGDFNGDGSKDVAIGVPAQADGGAVNVMYGSAGAGLTGSYKDQTWTQDSDGVADDNEIGDTFGNALAAGDFNGDGYADLAVGAPTEDHSGHDAAGMVHVLYGTADGLDAGDAQHWTQGNGGLPDGPEDEDWFGRSLTAGDFNGDGFADLAIGVYHQEVNGDEAAGAVHVIYGSGGGLSANAGPGNQYLHQDVAWMENEAEATDSFGLPLATGDINGDGFADLVAGIAGEAFGGTVNVGAIQVIYGSATGLGPQNQFVRQGLIEPGNQAFPGNPEVGDSFGWSLAVGNFNGDGFQDVAVGVPYENLENIAMEDAGAVHVFHGSASGLTPAGHQLWTDGIPETGDNYGFALTAGDFDADGFDDLTIGILNENVDNNTIMDAGSLNVLYGSGSGLGYANDLLFYQGAGGIVDTAEANDKFGQVLEAGDLNGDGARDLVVGVPSENLNDGSDEEMNDAGAIHVIYGSPAAGLSDTNDTLWWQGTQRRIHALLTDVQWEQTYGLGGGALFTKVPAGEPLTNHAASVTKNMTLLLAAEALDVPGWGFALDDEVTLSDLAGGTGGSKMKNAQGDVLETNDVMRLELLLYGMMLHSCNRSSVAIAQHVTGATDDFLVFSNRMNLKAAELNMVNTLYTHPAGGCITTPQDQVNLWLAGWQHPLFRQISTDRYYLGSHSCGEDADGDPKCFFGLTKLSDSGYPGLEGWKGGNGRLGPALDRPNCTSSLVAQATRLDRSLVLCMQQTGDRWGDNDRLFDYGYQRLFTPDNRGEGRLVGTMVNDFAVRRVTDTVSVTAVIDGQNNLRLDTWQVVVSLGQVQPLAGVVLPINDLAKGTNSLRSTLVDVTPLPTVGEAEADYLTGYLENGQLRLDVWRVGAEPGY